MTSFTDGYSDVFNTANDAAARMPLQDEIEHFRDSDLYRFIAPLGRRAHMPDYQALGIGLLNEPTVVTTLLAKSKPTLGYARPTDFCPLDMVDSRHIMMIAIIKRWLPDHLSNLNIVEIGGGFGNWARLCEGQIDYRRWTIIDLPFVNEVQRWYLSSILDDFSKITLIGTDHYPMWKQDKAFDLVIGAHSLSEFSSEIFDDYYENIVLKSQYFFYATHLAHPNTLLVNEKLDRINQHFECLATVHSEDDSVGNFLMVRKSNVGRDSTNFVAAPTEDQL